MFLDKISKIYKSSPLPLFDDAYLVGQVSFVSVVTLSHQLIIPFFMVMFYVIK